MAGLDAIHRELQRLDRELSHRAGLAGWMLEEAPLLPAAIGLMVGLAAAHLAAWPVWSWIVLLLAVSLVVAALGRRRLRWAPAAMLIGVGVAFAAVGVLRLAAFERPGRYDLTPSIGAEPILATLRGVVLTDVHQADRDDWLFGRYSWSGGGCSFYLRVTRARTPRGFEPARGTVRVQTDASAEVLSLEPGDRVQIYCRLAGFQQPLNPGTFDMAALMHRRGVCGAATVPAADGIILLEKAPRTSLWYWQTRLRRIVRQALLDDRIGDDQSRAIVEALLLGRRAGSPEVFEAFRRTGLAHFLCLSGLHFGILAGFVWRLARTAGLGKPGRAAMCLAVTVVYMMIVPPRAATLRAAVLCWFFCIAALVGRRGRPLNTLALTAIIMLLIRPMELFAADWQLSYGTVAGILLLYGPIRDRLGYALPGHRLAEGRVAWLGPWLDAGIAWARDLLGVGLAAWLGGAGILLYHFGTITPLSAILTVLIYPLVLGILMFGFIQLPLTMLFPTLATLTAAAATALGGVMVSLVQAIQHLPAVQVTIGHVPAWVIGLYYVMLLGWRLAPRQGLIRRPLVRAAAAIGLLVPILAFGYDRRPPGVELTVLSVGHGQAIHVALPDGRHWLFDAGSMNLRDPGRRVIVPYLRYRGVDELDAVIISHDDVDHLNAIAEVTADVRTRRVLTTEAVLVRTAEYSSAGLLGRHLQQRGVRIRSMDMDPIGIGPVRIERLWPDDVTCRDSTVSDNDKSLVMRIGCGGRAVLICSDIEAFGQAELLQQSDRLKADVLIMPHHGSRTHLNEHFVRAVDPRTIVVSCSRTREASAYHPPSGIQSFYTPTDGAVTIRIEPDGRAVVRGFRSAREIRIDPD